MDFSYVNDDGKKVAGAPAFNHFVYTTCGGVERYNDLVGKVYINKFVTDNSLSLNKQIEKIAKKSNLTRIGSGK